MAAIDYVATITPAEGKADRVQQLLEQMAKTVQAEEPGVLRYHMHRQVDAKGTPVFVVLETYKDEATFKSHGATSHMKKLIEEITRDSLLGKPIDLVKVSPFAGFASRL